MALNQRDNMHPIVAFTARYGPDLASWLLTHSAELGDAFGRLTRPVMAALTDPSASIDRIGSALIAQQNGHAEVIGLLHQHTTRLDAITTAVDGVGQSVGAVNHAIGALSSLSMIGLGVAVLSQVHIACQFAALTKRMKTIDRHVRAIQDMLEQKERADLDAGLISLGKAEKEPDPHWQREFTATAENRLSASRASYALALSNQLARPSPGAPAHVWMLARHLTTAVLGETTCHLRLAQPDHALDVLRSGLGVLQRHASAVFNRTIVPNPTQFLMPAMAEHHVTLDALAELYQQARHAGAWDGQQRTTATDLFESLRGHWERASDPRFGKAKKVQRLRADFVEAWAAVEEVNRLRGLALAIAQCQRTGQHYVALAEHIRERIAAERRPEGVYFAVFPPAVRAGDSGGSGSDRSPAGGRTDSRTDS